MSAFLKLKQIVETAFEKSERNESKITDNILSIDGMTGVMTRHFYNNLLHTDDARYLEIGTWKGSSVCSAMCGNKATVVCIDNWSEFGGPKEEFLKNFNNHKGENNASFLEQDCFTVNVSQLPKFNMYMYDGNHTTECHSKALVHYYDCLDDVFVFIVDDWNWDHVRNGTYDAIKQLKLTILYEKKIHTSSPIPPYVDRNTWWNGIYVAILQKQI